MSGAGDQPVSAPRKPRPARRWDDNEEEKEEEGEEESGDAAELVELRLRVWRVRGIISSQPVRAVPSCQTNPGISAAPHSLPLAQSKKETIS